MSRRVLAPLAFLLVLGACAPPEPPNIAVIVVDTLRADRMGIYDHDRPTTPHIETALARRGVVFENAYAQAPWTMPSMASMHAGRWPADVVGPDLGTMSIRDEATTLAEELASLGYRTAAFVGNPTMHDGAGFAQGFEVYSLPDSVRAMQFEHADHLEARLRPWLEEIGRGESGAPFFLYAHYIDTHGPYDNPDLIDGRSPFFPDYSGTARGTWLQGLFLGKLTLDDPERDVRHLRALYDSEIVYVDRFVGALVEEIASFAPNTLFVLTSDHGEELFDHGGWKHGRTLYEEQLHVPLVFRWDGVVADGERLERPVRLLDVPPTLVSAAGGSPPSGWDGNDLLPLLTGEAPPEPQPVFARHHHHGPVRATTIADEWKLVLFDRQTRFHPSTDHQRLLYRDEMERLDRIELYDLERDPAEQQNLSDERPDVVRRLQPGIHERLSGELPGLRILSAGIADGETVTGELRFDAPIGSWASYFLAPTDRVDVSGDTVRFELIGEALTKGLRLPGPSFDEIVELSAERGESGDEVPVLGPTGRRLEAPVNLSEVSATDWPPALRSRPGQDLSPRLVVWYADRDHPEEQRESDPETMRRLRALGYAD